MYIYGSFINRNGDTVTVRIVTGADTAETLEIGSGDSGVYFTDDPVEIECEVNDTFDHLLRHSASVRLLTSGYLGGLFSTSCRDAVVNIHRGDTCVFAGFIEPQSYSQPFNETLDELELNCIDALSALQYSNYKDIGSLGVLYSVVKGEAVQRTFRDIAAEILDGMTDGIDLTGGGTVRYLYDGSKAADSGSDGHGILDRLSISELLFLGDEEDDVWRQDEVLEELLRYLNLHIVQYGLDFHIFSWETVKGTGDIVWQDIAGGAEEVQSRGETTLSAENVADCDTTISIGEVYNLLLLTCDISEIENVIESPLDEDSLTSPFSNYQKYCTEYSADGEGTTAFQSFYWMTHRGTTSYGGASSTDWFVRVKTNSRWTFPKNGDTDTDLVSYWEDGSNQHGLPNYLGQNPGAAIIAWGSVETNMANTDNSPTSKVSMTDYMVISVNGNGIDAEGSYYPAADDIKACIPYAVYTGTGAGNYSPSDDDTVNYIVLSGSLVLNPLMDMTGTYPDLNATAMADFDKYWHKTVPSRNNGDGRYYTRKYWYAYTPSDDPAYDSTTSYGLIPFSDTGPKLYEFKYSAVGDSTDKISKVSVLACMLVIGDKCVVESGTQGQTSDFEWKTYKELSECESEDEYYQQCFYIGFDPAIGDSLVGVEFDFQNNISYTMGIDAEGIAIPVRRSDKVSGNVKFMILGPVNAIWDEYTRRHPTFFRHTTWSTSSIPLLAHVSSIMIKEFEVKVYSDNGLMDSSTGSGNDLIYMSDTDEKFTNRKDDIEFKINSALTTAECQEYGVAATINLSTPLDVSTEEGVLSIYDCNRGLEAKAEQLYVDSYYTEYHKPRLLMEQKLVDTGGAVGPFNHYKHPALDMTFFVQGISRNMMEGSATIELKEIEEDD